MEEERYTVSQVEEMTGIKGHVLRYWEEELELVIGRNAMGHRCYTRYDVQMFLNIKELKSRGLQLRAIKELVPKISRKGPGASTGKVKLLETVGQKRTEAQETLEKGKRTETVIEREPARALKEEANRERMEEFQRILERLLAQALKEKSHEERRCRSLDEAIRMHQQSRLEAAAAQKAKKQRKRCPFGKKQNM